MIKQELGKLIRKSILEKRPMRQIRTYLASTCIDIQQKQEDELYSVLYYPMTSNSNLYDRLLQESTLVFADSPLVQLARDSAIYLYTPALQTRISILQYYTHLNVYFLEKPQCLLTYLQKSPPSTVNLGLYLESLRALAQIYCGNAGKYKHLKQLYLMLARLPDVKERLSRDCTVPQDIALALDCLSKGERKENAELGDPQSQNIAYSKLVLLVTLFDHSSQAKVEVMWNQTIKIMEEGRLNGLRVFDLIMGSVSGKGAVQVCAILLAKFQKLIGGAAIVKHLLFRLENDYYSQGERLVFRARLANLLQDDNLPVPPNQDILRMLCVMSQQGTAKLDGIFPLLTPSAKFLCDVGEMHVDFHEEYVKRCWQHDYEGRTEVIECLWGELAFSSKLEFLNQMLLINDFKGFSKLIQRQGLKLDLIYHPRIITTLAFLLEWIIEPIHQIIGYTRYFPQKRPSLHFPSGSFQQCSQVSNYLIQSIAELLNHGKSYIFARKSTFTKFCRILRSICHSKDTRIPMESPQMGKKVGGFTANLIKRHILPAVEYYGNDPTVAFEFDRLMDCFRFKVQLDIYLHVIREQRLSNLHLAIHYHQVAQEQIKLLNRLSPGATQIINRMASLMSSHPFSALDPIFKRIQLNDTVLLSTIYTAIHKTPYLTKKVALFYTFLHLFEQSKPDCGKKYTCLMELTRQMLLNQRQPDDFVRTIIEYVASRLANPKEDPRLDVYKKEISFLTDILKGFLPTELEENFISKNNNCRYLATGPYSKIWLMEKVQEFYNREALRRSLLACMFRLNAKEIVENYFFYLLLKLNNRLIIVSQSLHAQLSVGGEIYDKILTLMLNLINIAHFQMTAPLVQRYFSLKIFKSLTNHYKLPYQLAFYLVRRLITHRMQGEGYNWTNAQTWQGLKSDLQGPLQLFFQQNVQFKQFQPNSYPHETITAFFRTDVFLIFWIQEIQYAHFNPKLYQEVLASIKKGCLKVKLDEDLLQHIKTDISAESKRYEDSYSKLKDSKGRRVIKEEYSSKLKCCQGGKQQQILNFVGLLIKYCILPRATLSKSQCYYCWQFYFNFLFENKYPTIVTVKLLCLLLESISSYIPFATLREASELLPLLYNSAAAAVKWKGLPQCNEKLLKRGLGSDKITSEVYDDLERIVYESQNQVVRLLFESKGLDEFSIKNCLHFVSACSSIPCFKEQADTIRLHHIKNSYEDSPALATMVVRLATQIDLRSANLRSYNSKVKTPTKATTAVKCWESLRMNQGQNQENDDLPITIDVETSLSSAFLQRSKKLKQTKVDTSLMSSKKLKPKSKSKTAKKETLSISIK